MTVLFSWNTGLLVPIERSGEHGRKTKTILRAPDKGAKAEGVGGFAWASNAAIPVVNLDPRKEEEYAAATYMSVRMVIDSADPEVDYSRVESKYEEILKTAFDNLLKGM